MPIAFIGFRRSWLTDADQLLVELGQAVQLVAHGLRFGAGRPLPLEQRGVLGFLNLCRAISV